MMVSTYKGLCCRWRYFRLRRRRSLVCGNIHYAGYTCLPCGTLIWDGFGAAEELKKRCGAEKIRRDCMDVVFYSGEDTGASTPGSGVDLPYRILSILGTPELVEELSELLQKWRNSKEGDTTEGREKLRRLEILLFEICRREHLPLPPDVDPPTHSEQMDVFPDWSYG